MSLFYGQRDNNGAINWKPADKPLTRSAATGATTNYKAPDGQNYWLTNNDKVTRWIARLEAAKKDLKGHSISSQEYGGKAQTMKASDFRSARGIDMDGSDSLRIKSEIALLQDSLAKEGKMVAMAATLYEQIDVASLGWINCDRFYNAPNVMDLAYNIVGKDSVGYAKVFVLFHDINSLMEGSYRSDATQSFIRKVPVGSNVTLIAMSIKGKKVFLSKVRTVTTPGAVVALNMNEATENEMKNLFK